MSGVWKALRKVKVSHVAVVIALVATAACGRGPTAPSASQEATSPAGAPLPMDDLNNLAPAGSKFGDVVGNFQGVTIYSNADVGKPSPAPTWTYGEKWQCVEFVRRYTSTKYGVLIPNANAIDYWNMSLSGLRRVSNGGIELPQIGDIIVMSGGASGFGHVAVVSAVSATAVTVAQQNTLSPSQMLPVTQVSLAGTPRYTMSALSGFTTVGWFTRKPAPILVPVIQAIAPVSPRVSTSPQSMGLSTSGVGNDVTLYLVDPYGNKIIFSKASLSLTPGGLVFRPTLTQPGNWSIQLQSAGLLSSKYGFTVLR